jgi:AcrR family transcriptional regulator
MKRAEIYNLLIETGRDLVCEKGVAALTVRKLSEASFCSVGTIYNQFANMENFIAAQNEITLDELLGRMRKVPAGGTDYQRLNRYLDAFVGFVLENQNLWFLLFDYHLNVSERKMGGAYMRKLATVTSFWRKPFAETFPRLEAGRRNLAMQVLWLSIFSMSSFLTTKVLNGFGRVDKKTVCKLLLNAYLAGIKALEKK